MKKPLNIGHRGAKAYFPENTLLAFEKAIEMGADGIELDVHLSFDGEIMVIHDATINRTTNGIGIVNELTLNELQSFSIDKTNKIPTLNEVLELVDKKCFINIELKSFEVTDKVVGLIREMIAEKDWNYNHFLVSSFYWNALQQLRILDYNIPIGVLTATDLDLAFAFAKFIKAKSINPYFHLLTKENCAEMQAKNLLVYAWTVNEINDIQQMIDCGVDGIISDFPDRVATLNAQI